MSVFIGSKIATAIRAAGKSIGAIYAGSRLVYGGWDLQPPPISFDPSFLYKDGTIGTWYDLSDLNTLFQTDVLSGSTPVYVTAPGQTIATILDKSRQSDWTIVDDTVWAVTSGDGVLSVSGNVLTVTGATVTTHVTRTGGSMSTVEGLTRMRATASVSGVLMWLRGSPDSLDAGVTKDRMVHTTNSTLDRLDFPAGTSSVTLNEVSYWDGSHTNQISASGRLLYGNSEGVHWGELDGVDDSISTPRALDFSTTDKVTLVFAASTDSTANQGVIKFGQAGAPGDFNALYTAGSPPGMRGSINGSVGNTQLKVETPALNTICVFTELFDLAGANANEEVKVRINGTLPEQIIGAPGPSGGGNFINPKQLVLGEWGGLHLKGRICQVVVAGRYLSESEIASTEAFIKTKAGY